MKLSKDKLKQIIKEEADKLLEARTPAYSDYEMDDISTDHQMVSLLREILSQLKTMNYFLTPAKSLAPSGMEKAIASYSVQEGKK
tara:strand:+ start:189 stop:443 length:255 start_codon:yes stop_codon:yes gene_type:complete